MTTYTSAQFATHMLQTIGLLAPDETPSADDLSWAEDVCNSEIQMLSVIGMPIWNGSEISIPQEYLTTLARRVGLSIAPSYGLTDIATAELAMREAERVLTLMASPQGQTPLTLNANDSRMGSRSGFNFLSGT